MIIYTADFKYYGLDITARTEHVLSPTWAIVREYKKGDIGQLGYTKLYHQLLFERKQRIDKWVKSHGIFEERILCCFCPPGGFCHRVIAARWLERNYRLVHYLGEKE